MLSNKNTIFINNEKQLQKERKLDNYELLFEENLETDNDEDLLNIKNLKANQAYDLILGKGVVFESSNLFANSAEDLFNPYLYLKTEFIEEADFVLQLKKQETVLEKEKEKGNFREIVVELNDLPLKKCQDVEFEVVNEDGELVLVKDVIVRIEK